MCERVSFDLPEQAEAAGVARRLVAAQCRRWELAALCDDAVLSVSELVANAVLHAGGAGTLTISVHDRFLHVAVRDDSPRVPIVRPVRLDVLADLDRVPACGSDAEMDDLRGAAWHTGGVGSSIAAGRGMLIVDAVAEEWGITQLETGKDVWFRIRLPQGRRENCPCPQQSASTRQGGRPVLT